MKNKMYILIFFMFSCLIMTNCTSATLKPWEEGAFETGEYRNMFLEMGYKQSEIDARLKQIYTDLFEGDNKIYFEANDSMAYISDIKNNDVRSEEISYGMMIAVQLDNKDMFDRLWRWSKHYMQHQEGPMKGYFRWSCKKDGTPNSMGPASDGELYFIRSEERRVGKECAARGALEEYDDAGAVAAGNTAARPGREQAP